MNLNTLLFQSYNQPPFLICVIPNFIALIILLLIFAFTMLVYFKMLKQHKMLRRASRRDHGDEYQFTDQSKKVISNYKQYKLKHSQSLHEELLKGIDSADDNAALLNQMDIDLFSFIIDEDSAASDLLEINLAIERANKFLLSTNKVIPRQLVDRVLNQVIRPNEIILWADCPYYKVRKEYVVKTSSAFYICSIVLDVCFAVIGAFIVSHPFDALSVSVMGLFTSFLFFLVGLYYTISLSSPNVLYVITNKRIINCRRKGFFRRATKAEIISYTDVPGILQVTKYQEKNNVVYGDILFQRNLSVINAQAKGQWKVEDSNIISLRGFKSIFHVEKVEKLLGALIELKSKGRPTRDSSQSSPQPMSENESANSLPQLVIEADDS